MEKEKDYGEKQKDYVENHKELKGGVDKELKGEVRRITRIVERRSEKN